MKTKRINGLQFEEALRSGLNNLRKSEQEINDLNVFPVPDGDTGTNMRLTLQHGIETAKSTPDCGAYLRQLSDGMLLGARGNSGVILSQIFRGLYLELGRAGSVNANDLRNGFVKGYRTAYSAVAHPVEGTILTVSREGIENIRTQIGRATFIEDMLGMYVAEMRKSLVHTPDMLDVLKEAGVVDSGAAGFILIIDGMLKCFYGEPVVSSETEEPRETHEAPSVPAVVFDENSAFVDGYCVEFILQRMNKEGYIREFSASKFTEALEKIGNSTVVVESGKIVKVHVHTMKPSRVFRLAEKFGEFLTVKVENMQIQHNEKIRKSEPPRKIVHKEFCIAAVANSNGMRKLYESLGADYVIDGGRTMNASAEDFLKAFSYLEARTIAVLPNNKNIIPAAEQAAGMEEEKRVVVLPSKSFADGYYALAMDVPGSPDHNFRIDSMREGIERVSTLIVTEATRDYEAGGISVKAGKTVSILGGDVVSSGDTIREALLSGLSKIDSIEDKENVLVFLGENAEEALRKEGSESDPEELFSEIVSEAYPMAEVSVFPTGQQVFDFVIGVI